MVDLTHYSGAVIDRAAERRTDETWVAARLADPESRFIPVWRGHSLINDLGTTDAVLLTAAEARDFIDHATVAPILLGMTNGHALFAIDISYLDDNEAALLGGDGHFVELYGVATQLVRDEASLLSHAAWLVHWAQKHNHCGTCGRPTTAAQAGHLRRCTDATCGALHFPRTDPAVIVLVEHQGRCLLARQRGWTGRLHSCLAGFVEPGEAAEEAVVREVFEEAGVRVHDVRFHATQPWPYPCSLMIGFFAQASDPTINMGDDELAEAGWYSRDDLRSPDLDIELPRHDSIARRLIDDWIARG
ncbi:MAG: NAD(+) diphosphatase [Pseudomonadota bacterium]